MSQSKLCSTLRRRHPLLESTAPSHFISPLFTLVLPPADNRPSAPPTSTKVSRSGRVIKPPLEYWKGGRVLIDAHMNVTIHETYDSSLCNSVSVHRPGLGGSSTCPQLITFSWFHTSGGQRHGDSAAVRPPSLALRRRTSAEQSSHCERIHPGASEKDFRSCQQTLRNQSHQVGEALPAT